MNKFLVSVLICSILYTAYGYQGDTTAPVTLAGSIIKAHQTENNKKYKRKECPVCKGKGWYISGDGIKRVDCGYCEPESGDKPSEITHPPVIIAPECKTRIFRR